MVSAGSYGNLGFTALVDGNFEGGFETERAAKRRQRTNQVQVGMGWAPLLNSCPCRFHEIDGNGSADVDSFLGGLFPFQHSHNKGQGGIGSASRNRLRTAS